MTNSPTLAARSVPVPTSEVWRHKAADPDFAAMWQEASEHAIDLLEARAFQRSLEGDLEPVYYMGVAVDYVRRFDGRLQIEMLRGLRAEKFKTPGHAQVNIGVKGDVFVLTEEQRRELQAINRTRILEEHAQSERESQSLESQSERSVPNA